MSAVPAGLPRLLDRYGERVAAGEIARDPAQEGVARRLDALNEALASRALARKGSHLGWFFARKAPAPRGLYVFGEVGRGKTMLVDAFFAIAAPTGKRRIHYAAFMAEVHERIHARRQAGDSGDPIAPVAAAIAAETKLLCLDEFAVEDIADAMILSRLFGALFGNGLVLVATSNAVPEDLYRDGLNRPLFLPFIGLLRQHCDVVELKARTDYRLEKLGRAQVYLTPIGPEADAALDRLWQELTGRERGSPASVEAKGGRTIPVPQAAKGTARFAFADLCDAPLGSADFLRVARAFHTVFIDGIPVIKDGERDRARRFINLVDAFYDTGVRLIVSAAAEPDRLYTATTGEESFAFRRTASRLVEMRSEAWLTAPPRRAEPAA